MADDPAAPFFDDPLNPAVAGLIVIVGIALLAHPLYLWPHYGQQQFFLEVEREPVAPEPAVAFETLTPDAQAAFEAAVEDGPQVLWSGEDDRVIDRFGSGPTIAYRGDTYRTRLGHTDSGGLVEPLLRWYASAAGAFLVAFGGWVLAVESWRPFTPTRGLTVPAAVAVAFLGTNAFDVLRSGVDGTVFRLTGLGILDLIPVTALFLAVGAEVARNGRDSRLARWGAVGILLVVVAVFGNLSFAFGAIVVLPILVIYTAIGGAPWFWLGYRLSRPARPRSAGGSAGPRTRPSR